MNKLEDKKVSYLLGIVIALVALTFVFILTRSGNKEPVYSIDNGVLQISSMYGQKINLSDIQSVQLKYDPPANLKRVNGYGFGSIVKGKCSSDLGAVTVFIDTSKPPYIYLMTSEGLVVLNDKSAADTQSFYEKLNSSVSK